MGVFERDVDNVRNELVAWTPVALALEKDYEDAAYRYLNDRFPKDKFERQYARGRTRADLYVDFSDGATVAIELKRDLQDRGEYHRLIGQVWEYLTEWRVEALIVLCGDTDPALRKNIERFVDFVNAHQKYKLRFLHVVCAPTRTNAAGAEASS
jgi:hypothetical protein